jgi:hypothetical protein
MLLITARSASDAAVASAINNKSAKTGGVYAADADRIAIGNKLRFAVAERLISAGLENGMENTAPISLAERRASKRKA